MCVYLKVNRCKQNTLAKQNAPTYPTGWKKMQNVLGILSKIASKCNFFTNFQNFLEEIDQNIHLNDEFPLKIAKISLQKLNFLGMRFPNSTFFSMHDIQ